jgi:hypothetical protein
LKSLERAGFLTVLAAEIKVSRRHSCMRNIDITPYPHSHMLVKALAVSGRQTDIWSFGWPCRPHSRRGPQRGMEHFTQGLDGGKPFNTWGAFQKRRSSAKRTHFKGNRFG